MTLRLTRVFSFTMLSAVYVCAPGRADAQVADLFISEYIEGSSNNKALEIYNGTNSPVDLGAGQYTIEMYFNGATTSNLLHNLTGTVAAGGTFVLTNPAATLAGILSASNQQTASSAWYNGDDAVVLRKNNGGTTLDVIGQVGFDPGTEWGTGLVSTADNTIRRKATVCAGDTNASDAFDPAVQWDGFATDTVSGLGSHTASCTTDLAPTVTGTIPSSGGKVGSNANLSVTFSEDVTAASGAFTLSCTTSGSVALAVTGGPRTFTLDPAVGLAPTDSCTLTVNAALVSDQDGTPTQMASNFTLPFAAVPCGAASTAISAVQGTGLASPLVGTVVEIEGVVVGDFQGDTGLGGFFLQQTVPDGNAATSDGIFVYDPATTAQVQAGDIVRVRGSVAEFFDQTELENIEWAGVCSSGNALPAPTLVPLPNLSLTDPERYEGMRVTFANNSLFVTENYNQGRFGEVTLATGGRQFSPTNVAAPGAAAAAVDAANKLARIELDDGSSVENPLPDVPYLGANGTLRPGDRLNGALTGVLGYAFGTYEVHPTAAVGFTSLNARPANPTVTGSLKLAVYNLLNYFTTLDVGTTGCGPTGALECRGAPTAGEFARQRAKTKESLRLLGADIYGLAEVQNDNGSPDTLLDVAAMLNESFGVGTYVPITTGAIGTDAIKVGFVYRVAAVEPVGAPQILQTPAFIPTKSRPAVAVTFRQKSNGAKFTAIMNHLKSKGSSCSDIGDNLDPNGQGECNQTRVAAANELKRWIQQDLPAITHDADYVIMGDLNAYAKEDPIVAFENGGYTNEIKARLGSQTYDFVFEGGAGSLSNVLANSSMHSQITGILEWHANSDEPRAFDYHAFNQPSAYHADQWRASDHDALLVGLNLSPTAVPASPRWAVFAMSALLALVGGFVTAGVRRNRRRAV